MHCALVQIKRVLFLGRDEAGEFCLDQIAPLNPEHGAQREIRRHDGVVIGQRQISNRSEVVEVTEFVAGMRQICLGASQFFVLHLQLDLMHFELVKRLAYALDRHSARVRG